MANFMDENTVLNINLVQMKDIESDMRPQDTKSFRKTFAEYPYDFPLFNSPGINPVSVNPLDTRGNFQNKLVILRHFNK